jgi:hypothetical protein
MALMCRRRAKGWSFPGEEGTPSLGPPSECGSASEYAARLRQKDDGGKKRPDPAMALMCLRRAKGWSFPGEAGTPSPGPPSECRRSGGGSRINYSKPDLMEA